MPSGRSHSTHPAGPIAEIACAKVNLTLRVIGRRLDGYHELESLVAFADVGDSVTLTPGAQCRVEVSGPFAPLDRGRESADAGARPPRQA